MNSSALKMACLSVGLATAWSTLVVPQVSAGTVVDVKLTVGGTTNPLAYKSVFVGLLFAGGDSPEIYSLGDFNSLGNYDSYLTTTSSNTITGFVTVGVSGHSVPGDPHVMVSIASPSLFTPLDWDTVFGAVPTEATVAASPASLSTFLSSLLASASPAIVQQGLDFSGSLQSASLQEFTLATPSAGEVSLVVVPLPNECLIGGGLFAMLAFSKRSIKWTRIRESAGWV